MPRPTSTHGPGFIVRYTYWIAQVLAVGGEAVAVGVYMTFWFPNVPVWLWSVGFAAVLLFVNSRSVKNFGTFEYWFALIKVVGHHRLHRARPQRHPRESAAPPSAFTTWSACPAASCRTASMASGWR